MSERTCTNCQSAIPGGAQFCTTCGTAAPPEAGPDPTTVMPTADAPAAPAWDAPGPPPAPEPGAAWQAPPPPTQPAPAAPPAPSWSAPAPQPPTQPAPGAPAAWSPPPPAAAPAPQAAAAWAQPQPQQQPGWQQPQGGPPTQAYGQQPPTQYAPPGQVGGYQVAAKKKRNTFGALTAFIGAVLFVAGVFTPWVRTTVSSGISGWKVSDDAKVVVGLAVAALLVGVVVLAGVRNVLLKLVLIGLGIAGIAIAVVDILSVGSDIPDVLNAKIGVGLILVPIGGFFLLLSGLFTRAAK